MGFDLEFFPVGNESQNGDSICIRYGNLFGKREEQKVILIDGGFQDTSDTIINHIKNSYNTKIIDLVILTHPDQDHTSGLNKIFEELKIIKFWMHRPWEHAGDIISYFKDKRLTNRSLKDKIIETYPYAYDIEQLAIKHGIVPTEPFQGEQYENNTIRILSPSYPLYLQLLLNCESLPEPEDKYLLPKYTFYKKIRKTINWIKESRDIENLVNPQINDTSIENQSSCIIYFCRDNWKILLTSDTSILGFNNMIKYCNNYNIDISNLSVLQMPHHGSKHNIGPNILNTILNKPILEGAPWKGTAIASVSKNSDENHPSKRVTNALIRRGYKPFQTKGSMIMWNINSPRSGEKATQIPFYNEVEED